MAKQKYLLTQEDYDKLVRERQKIIEVDIPNNLEDLNLARSQGDLSENADYDAAKSEQSRLNARIEELNDRIDNCEIIKYEGNHIVGIGTKIQVKDHSTGEVFLIRIGGHEGSKPFDEIVSVSNESPFGKAVLGKKVGDTVTVEVSPKYDVTILSIEKDDTKSKE